MKPRSNPASSRDAGIHAEAIIASVLTLAVVGTEKQNAPKYVVGQYKKILQELRTSDSGAFN